MPSHSVECPICFQNFSSDFIEAHAQRCKGVMKPRCHSNDDDMPSAKKAKISSPKPTQSFFNFKQNSKSSMNNGSINAKNGDEKTKRSHIFHDDPPMTKRTSKKPSDMHSVPLAERSRPSTTDEYIGQEKVLGKGCVLNELLRNNTIPSMILWGPPGCGKTSLAHVIATKAKNTPNSSIRFVKMSATNSGKADVTAMVKTAKNDQQMFKRKTVLFIDEIHRFNKMQQDTFLPHVEDGTIVLIGATTENPSFSLNSALLSRCRVIILEKLSIKEIKTILMRALRKFEKDVRVITTGEGSSLKAESSSCEIISSPDCEIVEENITESKITISEEVIKFLASICDGDARTALSGLQMAIQAARSAIVNENNNTYQIDIEMIKKSLHRSHVSYDRTGDQHYEMISAFQKSIRGSDDNATLYWLARMLEGGEDPKFIARRLIRIASEDIGLGDSTALNLAISAQQACQFIGMPECDVVLAHCAVYMARAPKSVEVYMAYNRAKEKIKYHEGPLPGVPLHLRNASTKLMKELGYGKGYQYKPPDDNSQTYLPDSMLGCNFFDGTLPSL
uniref:ATPase WRNIP1-like n=1 Tax=Styela clava TaxID=7725 RepID=UPI001939F0B5|nr:ATPase WRNIP1-like [Styela clava]